MSQAVITTTKPKKEDLEMTYKAFGSDVDVKLSISIVRQYFTKPTKQGYEASDADCMKFMLLCRAGALNPAERDAYLVGYDGSNGPEFSMTVAQSAFLKRAEANENNDGLESGVIVLSKSSEIIERQGDFYLDGETVLGGWAKAFRKDVSRPYVSRLRLDTRKKDNKFWNGDKAGMIVKCAEADALRQAFPTKLGALYIEGELREPDARDITPPKRTTARAVPLNPFPQPAAIEAPKEAPAIIEAVEDENGQLVKFLRDLNDVDTIEGLSAFKLDCASFINEADRTVAKRAVDEQADALALRWDEKSGQYLPV